jgi:hypothetical protein
MAKSGVTVPKARRSAVVRLVREWPCEVIFQMDCSALSCSRSR